VLPTLTKYHRCSLHPNNPTNYHPVGNRAFETQINHALNWLRNRQVLHVKGDWVYRKPHVQPGCWAFQLNNTYFIDPDNTSVVVMLMDHACQQFGKGDNEAIACGKDWVMGFQSKKGGFVAREVGNTHLYINNIPLADSGSLLDPPTVDVTACVVGMLAQLHESVVDSST
jgi:squalene-hopene/tetraprenyl-beta-curcumene cyclase